MLPIVERKNESTEFYLLYLSSFAALNCNCLLIILDSSDFLEHFLTTFDKHLFWAVTLYLKEMKTYIFGFIEYFGSFHFNDLTMLIFIEMESCT